jgi:hypothetical protein
VLPVVPLLVVLPDALAVAADLALLAGRRHGRVAGAEDAFADGAWSRWMRRRGSLTLICRRVARRRRHSGWREAAIDADVIRAPDEVGVVGVELLEGREEVVVAAVACPIERLLTIVGERS